MFLWDRFEVLALVPIEYCASLLGGNVMGSPTKSTYRAHAMVERETVGREIFGHRHRYRIEF